MHFCKHLSALGISHTKQPACAINIRFTDMMSVVLTTASNSAMTLYAVACMQPKCRP
jgi:hypothetical protein